MPSELDAIAGAMEQLDRQLAEVEAFLPGSNPVAANADDLERGLRGLLADQVTLNKLPILYELKTELVRLELGALLRELARRHVDPEAALEIYAHAWLSSIVEEVGRTDPLIAGFDGTQHRPAVADYRQADRQHVETTALRVRRICAERAVAVQDEHREQSDLVRYQASLKRKHLPIRQLFEAAPDVLTALTPCWVMSPLLVSQLLPADQQYFDVVVLDEASQIEPADAIPAILRGKSVVVAGDDRQLPPTSFFATANPQEEDADADPARLAVGTDFESILDALSAFMPMRMLLWHYSSRDERLIVFSNRHFYDRALTTFPGITENDCLEHVLVPFTQGYQGSDVSASAEVETVVDHVMARPITRLRPHAIAIGCVKTTSTLARLRVCSPAPNGSDGSSTASGQPTGSRDQGKEVDAAKAAYDRAVAEADEPPGRERVPIAGGQTTSVAVTKHPTRDPWPGGVRRGLPIGEYSRTELEAVVRYVESDTLLRTQDELLQAVMDELGFLRRGKNIVGAIEAAISGIRR